MPGITRFFFHPFPHARSIFTTPWGQGPVKVAGGATVPIGLGVSHEDQTGFIQHESCNRITTNLGLYNMSSPMSETFAAVDLGSNSFHMVVAKFEDGQVRIIDRIKDMVRIASGLDSHNNLSEEAMERAFQSLHQFGQRIREIPRANVKAVGTNTLRQARNGHDFIRRAREALGHNIDIISGQEEARLVFLGVAQTYYNKNGTSLVIDIGGGSTELIIGKGFQPKAAESLYMGCVNVSRRFFADGSVTGKRMREAILFARTELESIESRYRRIGWDSVLGSSGTIRSIAEIAVAQGWSEEGVTRAAVETLRKRLIAAGHYDKLFLEGLSERRKPVFAGGLAILSAAIDALHLEHIQVSDGALREGIIYELIGRYQNKDIRKATVADIATRYGVDQEQADKVAKTAETLYDQVRKHWPFDETDRDTLLWSAQLHEIGLAIAHAQYHRHGAYLLSNSDMPGFSRQEQYNLSLLVRAHRRKFPTLEFNQAAPDNRENVLCLAVLLRLSCVLNRSRSYSAPPKVKADADTNTLSLKFPGDWLGNHALTRADLETEAGYLEAIGFKLKFG